MRGTDRSWIEVEKKALLHNIGELKKITGRSCVLMPAVKANAYGHGDVLISRILQDAGVTDFCVASAEEGIRLRKEGITGEILILGYTHPDAFPELRRYGLTQTVVDIDYARVLSEFGGNIAVHAGVDTGMHRLGIPSDRMELIESVWTLPGIRVTGVFSHLCVSDGITRQAKEYTREQIRRFTQVTDELRRKGIRGFRSHIQGSYGILNYPAYSFDMARPGIALYGVMSSEKDKVMAKMRLKPVLALKARIGCVKELSEGESAGYGLTYTAQSRRRIAIAGIGYADGIPRSLSNCGHALVRGVRVPIIGRICMDQLTLDVTDVPGAAAGDEAVFIGCSKESRITAEEVAKEAGTITNEILSRLGGRLGRIVV